MDIESRDISDENVIPYSVAEMEFHVAPAISEAIKRTADFGVYGYMGPEAGYFDSVHSWMKRRHEWDVKPEWLVKASGVVPAINIAVNAFTEKGDGVIIQTPVYYPFHTVTENNGRKLVFYPLKIENSEYVMDFEDLRKKTEDPKNKIIIISNPHNPVGRVWRKD